jgi:hypothetical protein
VEVLLRKAATPYSGQLRHLAAGTAGHLIRQLTRQRGAAVVELHIHLVEGSGRALPVTLQPLPHRKETTVGKIGTKVAHHQLVVAVVAQAQLVLMRQVLVHPALAARAESFQQGPEHIMLAAAAVGRAA